MAAVSLCYPSAVPAEEICRTFGDEPAAVSFFEQVRWPKGPVCPQCEVEDKSRFPDDSGRRWCGGCRRRYSVRTGTMLARGHPPLRAWAIGAALTANGPFVVRPGTLSQVDGISPGAARTVADGIHSVCGSRVSPYDRPQQLARRITQAEGDSSPASPGESCREPLGWIAELSDHQPAIPDGVDRWLTPPTPPEQLAVTLPPHPRPGIAKSEVLVLTVLRSYLGGADSSTVADAAAITRRSTQRVLRGLEGDGYVDSEVVEVPWKHRTRRILNWRLAPTNPAAALLPYLPMMRWRRRAPCPESLPADIWYLFWSGPDPADIRLPRDAMVVANRLLNGRLLDFDARRWALRHLPLKTLVAQTGIPGCPPSVEMAVAELLEHESGKAGHSTPIGAK